MNKRGFTLVELLAVIVILGVLATISIVGVSRITTKGRESYYKRQEELILAAGKNYFSDKKSERPYEIGGESRVTLNELIAEKYIEPVKDYKNNECDPAGEPEEEGSYVTIEKASEKKYDYGVYLDCPDYRTGSSGKVNDDTPPVISFDPPTAEAENKQDVEIKISDNESGVANYRYRIVKNNDEKEVIYDSKSHVYKENPIAEITEEGEFYIEAYAKNKDAKSSGWVTSGIYKLTITAADCENMITVMADEEEINPEEWTNKNVTIVFKGVSNNSIKYYTIEESTDNGRTFKELQKRLTKKHQIIKNKTTVTQYRVTGYNAKGETCETTKTIKIDKDPPTGKPIVTGPKLGDGYGAGAVAKASCQDTGTIQSGIKSQPNDTVTFTGTGAFTLKFTCVDNAGNVKNISKRYNYHRNDSKCGYTCVGGYDTYTTTCSGYRKVIIGPPASNMGCGHYGTSSAFACGSMCCRYKPYTYSCSKSRWNSCKTRNNKSCWY